MSWGFPFLSFLFFLSSPEDMVVDFRERGRKGEREGEKHRCERDTSIGCLLYLSLLWDRTCNLGTCPGQESNPRRFGYGMTFQSTEPHWPGQRWHFPILQIISCVGTSTLAQMTKILRWSLGPTRSRGQKLYDCEPQVLMPHESVVT